VTRIKKLSAAFVSSCKLPGRYGDGQGLYLQVSQHGDSISKQWLYRFQINGRSRQMGLGSASTFSLAEARQRAEGPRKQVADRIDPIAARDKERLEQQAQQVERLTLKEAAERFIAGHEKKWTNVRHARQWRATLETYAYPRIGKLAVDAIGKAHIIEVLEPHWQSKTETMSRLRGRIEQILDWCRARGLRSGENPARWKGHLDKVFPDRKELKKVEHLAAMPYAQVPTFLAALKGVEGFAARALELTTLCASRTDEVLAARWCEFDLDAKTWTIPAERMKGDREHVVPLSDEAVALLRALPRVAHEELVFPGRRAGRPLGHDRMLDRLRALPGCADFTVHGLRSSFRDWAGNETSFPREIAEAQLAHLTGSQVERAYRRSDALAKRAKLVQAWARYCSTPAAVEDGNVTPMRRKVSQV
jgi:integrase